MARNEEKALTLFNKWHTFKQEFHAVSGNRRPLFSSQVESLPDAEKFRREIISKITKNIAAIKNAELGEHKIREMNDEINKLMKQKYYWEIRIRELGGNLPIGKQFYDIEGKELPGTPGYKYYGAAKELPGIRELFMEASEEQEEIQKQNRKRKIRKDLYAQLTPEYFGFVSTEDDPEYQAMIQEEIQSEKEFIRNYRTENYQKILSHKEDPEELKALENLSKIPELVAEYVKSLGAEQQQQFSSHPLHVDLLSLSEKSAADALTEARRHDNKPQGIPTTDEGPTTTSPAAEEPAKEEEDVVSSKKALLDKLGFLL